MLIGVWCCVLIGVLGCVLCPLLLFAKGWQLILCKVWEIRVCHVFASSILYSICSICSIHCTALLKSYDTNENVKLKILNGK